MKTNFKSTFIPQNNQPNADSDPAVKGWEKDLIFHVQTGLRAGWVPGSNARESLRNFRASLPDEFMVPEIR